MFTLRTILLAAALTSPHLHALPASDPSPVEGGYGMVRGPGYAFLLKAPAGWVIDASSGAEQGLPAVFYPKGSSWSESPVVGYARARPKTRSVSTVEETVKAVVGALRSGGNPRCVAKPLQTIRTGNGQEGVIYRFDGLKSGDVEATAYFPEKRTLDFITLSCRSEKAFDASLGAFRQLVASYEFQTDKIPADPNTQGYFRDGSPKD